ncbi:hypothetical protein PHIN6_02970 [Polynucleobacter sp. HIN6]|nr:hypothetical protein PHIN6_02970 [Polynucleobacter sp. HIN6]
MVLIANAAWASLAEETHQFDEILPIKVNQFKRSLTYRFSIIRKIRKLGIEFLISPVYSRDFYAVDLIVRSSGAKLKIGFRGDTTNITPLLKGFTDNWYTRFIEGDFARLSEIDKNAEFIRGLGGKPASGLATLHPSPRILDHSYFVLVPGGSWRGRCWPTEKFIELSRRIQQKYNIPGLICGTAQESFLADAINAGLEIPLSNLCGQTSLDQLIDIINNASLLITNETGTVHIGANLGTPTVCMLGGGHFGRFFPYPPDLMPSAVEAIYFPMECYGCNWNCIYEVPKNEAVPCIQMISVDSVWQSASRQLDKFMLKKLDSIEPH